MAERNERNLSPFVEPRRAESGTARWLLIAATALLAFAAGYLFKLNAELRGKVDDIVSPRTRIISMVGEEAPQANAKVLWDTKAQQWSIYIFDLPAPPSDKDYQLWYVTKNAKISAAVFRTDEEGRTVLKLTLPPDALADLAATAVTLEPRGGSPQPTGKFYLKASI
jgi:anti-sigma-K factor RskA